MANVNAGSKKHEFSSMIGAPSSDAGHIAEPAGSSGVVRRRASRNGAIMFGAVVFAVAFCLVAALWWALSGEVSLPALVVAALGGWLAASSIHVVLEWEKAVVLRFGKFNRVLVRASFSPFLSLSFTRCASISALRPRISGLKRR